MSARAQRGQARAFGWIADGAKVVDDLDAKAADTNRPIAKRLADALRAEGAHMVADAYERAMKEGIPPRD